MKKFNKAGLLIITLVIPALIFTFLRFFATNHYSIPFYHPLTDTDGRIRMNGKDTMFYSVQKLNAVTIAGNDLPQHPFKGKLTVINYLPDSCQDSCQIIQSNLERIQSLVKEIKGLNMITISDTTTNELKVSPRYTGKSGWTMAKVNPEDLSMVLDETLKFQTKVPKAKTNSLESKLMLIDKDEHIRGYYNGYDPEEINRLMAEIKILNFEKGAVTQN